MKIQNSFLAIVLASVVFIAGCELPVLTDSFRIETPVVPELWLQILGTPRWHLEWIATDGKPVTADIDGNYFEGAALMLAYATPITALPYWENKNIPAGIMKPAGGIFPNDASGGTIRLSWRGGIDAFFYKELAKAAAVKRAPYKFNWQKFRLLWSESQLPQEILDDPWLADWVLIAQKTEASGFDKRRISLPKRAMLTILLPSDGPWIGQSPFMKAPSWQAGKKTQLAVSETVDTYFCEAGFIRCNTSTWVWENFEQ